MVWWVLLGVACGSAWGAGAWFRWAYGRLDVPVVAGRRERLGLYDVAFLSGGGERVAETAMAVMLLEGRLSVQDMVVTVLDPVPRDAVEAAVVQVVGPGPRRRMWRRLSRLGRCPAIDAVGDRLAGLELVASPSRYRVYEAADAASLMARVVSAVLGLVAVGFALARHGPVLVVLGVTVAAVGGGELFRWGTDWLPKGATQRGRAALAKYERRCRRGEWAPSADGGPGRGEGDTVVLCEVACWGLRERLPALWEAVRLPAYSGSPIGDGPGLGGV
ncbi:TIGR04222 domain-containing membrane protein [Streptomyces capoamus]|uniref:TIGR04222 domain-containing membrane protein n=1 Tax=Streptomyces capoamus TaxID=68183 RepID=UPI003C2F40AC